MYALCYSSFLGHATVPDSMGREFVFSTPTPRDLYNFNHYVMITTTSSSPIRVNTSVPGVGFSNTTVVSRDVIGKVNLPTSVYPRGDGRYNKSIIIRADGDVSVYVMSIRYDSGFLVMPTSMLGKEYIVASSSPHYFTYPAEFTVTALTNITRITIETRIGENRDVLLQPYESYQMTSEYDLTGSTIHADQPISVMSGISCGQIPIGTYNCRYMVTHLKDINLFGTQFVLAPFLGRRTGYIFRVISAQIATHVEVNSEEQLELTDLHRGDFYEGESTSILTIICNKPVLVVQFAKGKDSGDYVGNPVMVTVPPISMFPSRLSVFPVTTFQTNEEQTYYISVTISCEHKDTLYLDRVSPEWNEILKLSPDTVDHFPGQMCVLRREITAGVHSVSHLSEEAHFSVLVHGIGKYSAYAYMTGFNSRVTLTSNTTAMTATALKIQEKGECFL